MKTRAANIQAVETQAEAEQRAKRRDFWSFSTKSRVLPAVPLIAVLAYFGADYVRHAPAARATQGIIETELRDIPAPSGSKETGFHSFGKTHGGAVTRDLISPLHPGDIESFYDGLFRDLGWNVLLEEEREGNLRDVFCRERETAVVTVPKKPSTDDTRFEVKIAWGDAGQCNQ